MLGYFYKQDRISAINALAVSPKRKRLGLYVRLRRRNLNGLDVLLFLRHLLRHLRGHIFLLWDRGTIHKRLEVRQFISRHRRLHIEWFPAYAPELNPAEHVWNQNDSALANGSPSDLNQLDYSLRFSMQRVRGSQKLLWFCIYASDLPWGVINLSITYATFNNIDRLVPEFLDGIAVYYSKLSTDQAFLKCFMMNGKSEI